MYENAISLLEQAKEAVAQDVADGKVSTSPGSFTIVAPNGATISGSGDRDLIQQIYQILVSQVI